MFNVLGISEANLHSLMVPLWHLREANRRAMRDLFDQEGETIRGIMADVTDEVSEQASQLAPYLTGTLASAHRSRLEPAGPAHLTGIVYVDPTVVNPVFGGYPAVYGVDVHASQPWFTWTVLLVQETAVSQVRNGVHIAIEEIYD